MLDYEYTAVKYLAIITVVIVAYIIYTCFY